MKRASDLARSRARLVTATVVVAAFLLSGCAMGDNRPTETEKEVPMSATTLEVAKADAIRVIREVLDLVPDENIGDERFVEESTLMECGDGEFKWPGGSTVILTGDFPVADFLSSVEEHFSAQDGWTVTTDEVDGSRGVEARNADGLSIYTYTAREDTEIRLRSFSVCFPFDPVVGKRY